MTPYWYAIVSESCPAINTTRKTEPEAASLAGKLREDYPDVEVVPMYRAEGARAGDGNFPGDELPDANLHSLADHYGVITAMEQGGGDFDDLLPMLRSVEQHARWAAVQKMQQRSAALVKAAVNLLAECDTNLSTKPAPQRFGVPYGALNALHDALQGIEPPECPSAIAALRELVAVKDLKERTEAIHFAGLHSVHGADWETHYNAGRAEYIRRQPDAWEAARAVLAAAPAAAPAWQPIETAPKVAVFQDGIHHYAERVLVWWPGAGTEPVRARWWFTDGGTSNFIADGNYAVFPTVWMRLPSPPGIQAPATAAGSQS